MLTIEKQHMYHFRIATQVGTFPSISYEYPIMVHAEPACWDLIQRLRTLHADHFTLVVDAGLPEQISELMISCLEAVSVPFLVIPLDASEQSKVMPTATFIAEQARLSGGGTHASCFLALGGGLIGNITGLAASLMVRGVRLVHIPTTLLAATDSVLSCKQGVNGQLSDQQLIKNLMGTFKAPEFVWICLSFWQSLPEDEIRSGLCELIKNVLAIHLHRYDEVATLLNPQARYSLEQYAQIFAWCFEAKQEVMRQDAHEQGAALVLEAGHTVGHALESLVGMKHGLAIGLGLLVEAHISHARGLMRAEELQQHYTLLQRNGAPTALAVTLDAEALLHLIGSDNKIGYLPRRAGQHALVLFAHLGQPLAEQPGLPLTYVTDEEIRAALARLQV